MIFAGIASFLQLDTFGTVMVFNDVSWRVVWQYFAKAYVCDDAKWDRNEVNYVVAMGGHY